MKDCALICKLIGIWPRKGALVRWIQLTWQLNGGIDIEVRAQDFFMMIFENLEDKDRVFKSDLEFFNNSMVFMKF